ncbi:MAG: conjugal transfer protein TraG, partial [Mucilaginibacter sp.]|nr:conjugal transfer protein TraG [Mucilaginibacter sp.]
AIKEEEGGYKELPKVRQIDTDMIMSNYLNIKKDIESIIAKELSMKEMAINN